MRSCGSHGSSGRFQIDGGKPAAMRAFVRILDHLNRLAPERPRLRTAR
jgi:hypothetical protein